MSDFTVLATNHTSFTVSSLDRTVAFFTEALGFALLSRAPRDPNAMQRITGVTGGEAEIAFVQGPGHRIELIEYKNPSERQTVDSQPWHTGFAHVAYDVDDIDAAVAAAGQHGFSLTGEVYVIDKGPNAGRRVCYLSDRDAIAIEFIEVKSA
ncbi:MAG: bleomycin resistance protein [Rhodospirillaceae bacterium]|nr:bleomycin resistance protein [Rhodospirillaceae bacterium]